MKKTKLDLNTIKKLDKSDMLKLLMDFPGQCRAALDIGKKAELLFKNKDFKKIAFAGLGGSAIGADLVKSYLYFEGALPITVIREYDLPGYVDDSTLLFVSSYSGNTEETLSAYAQSREKGATVIAVSSGGKLKELALKDKVTFIQIPANQPPRTALGYMSIIPLLAMEKLGLVKEVASRVNLAIKVLEELRDKSLDARIASQDNIAKTAALELFNRFTVIYSGSIYFDVCAVRLRGQLAENSKALASSHVFPEMNHNEIVGWQNPAKLFRDFTVVLLRDTKMHPRVAKRMDITGEIIRKGGVRLLEIWPRGEDLLSRILSVIYIGDFISFYLAILYGIDPTPVERVTYLKERLSQAE
ncbi:MAG: bifunctional phosphoglucose/phosphomannose isomerase [Candidatus Omnitrophota bacterium]